MSNVITHVFKNNNVRTVEVDGTPMFIAKDVAEALGYKDTDYAIRTHCKKVGSWAGESSGQVRTLKTIPESDVYRLVMRSKLESAATHLLAREICRAKMVGVVRCW